jgi:hypothetical protein
MLAGAGGWLGCRRRSFASRATQLTAKFSHLGFDVIKLVLVAN